MTTAPNPCPAYPAHLAAARTTIVPSRCRAFLVRRAAAATATAPNHSVSACRLAGRRGTRVGCRLVVRNRLATL